VRQFQRRWEDLANKLLPRSTYAKTAQLRGDRLIHRRTGNRMAQPPLEGLQKSVESERTQVSAVLTNTDDGAFESRLPDSAICSGQVSLDVVLNRLAS
jgi:hypothetical protein